MSTTPDRLARARREVSRMQRKIARAHAAGRTNRAAKLRRLLMRSWSARLVANDLGHRRARTGLPHEVVAHGAAYLDPWRGGGGMARRRTTEKSSGGERVHFVFNAEGRALQYIVRLALEPGADRPWDMMRRGRGKDAMARAVAERMAENEWIVCADVKSAYDSMCDAEGIASLLPLPRAVVDDVILGRGLRVAGPRTPRNRCPYKSGRPTRRREGGETAPQASGACGGVGSSLDSPSITSGAGNGASPPPPHTLNPPGVVQGSACSDLAMAWLMVPVAEALGGELLVHGDDVVTWAGSEAEARGRAETLAAALAAHPAGNARLKHCHVRHRSGGIFVCGYWIRWRRGGAVVTPYPETINLMLPRAWDALDLRAMHIPWQERVAPARKLLLSFRAAWPEWRARYGFLNAIFKFCLAEVEVRVWPWNRTDWRRWRR